MRAGSRRSFRHAASRAAMLSRSSTPRRSNTPASDDSIPPSNATLTFLRATTGRSKDKSVSSPMTDVVLLDRSHETVSPPESCDKSRLAATSVAQNLAASRIGRAIDPDVAHDGTREAIIEFDFIELGHEPITAWQHNDEGVR